MAFALDQVALGESVESLADRDVADREDLEAISLLGGNGIQICTGVIGGGVDVADQGDRDQCRVAIGRNHTRRFRGACRGCFSGRS